MKYNPKQILTKIICKNTVNFEYRDGLSEETLCKIEKEYGFKLPEFFRELLREFCPVKDDKGYYAKLDDFSELNTAYNKSKNSMPLFFIERLNDGSYWCNKWGSRPTNAEAVRNSFAEKTKNAPKLVWLCGNLYFPIIDNCEDPPLIACDYINNFRLAYSSLSAFFKYALSDESESEWVIKHINESVSIPFWNDFTD